MFGADNGSAGVADSAPAQKSVPCADHDAYFVSASISVPKAEIWTCKQ